MQGHPTNLDIVGQGPTALQYCLLRVVCIYIPSRLSFLFSFSLEDSSIYTKILSRRAVKPKTTNQAIKEKLVGVRQ